MCNIVSLSSAIVSRLEASLAVLGAGLTFSTEEEDAEWSCEDWGVYEGKKRLRCGDFKTNGMM